MTPKASGVSVIAADIDRLISLSEATVLAKPAQASAARETMLRVRNDLADNGVSADLLDRM